MCESVSIIDDCFTLVILGAIYYITTVTQMTRLARFTSQIYLRASQLIILMQKHYRNNVKFIVVWRMSKTKYIKFSGWHLEILKKGVILFIRSIIVFICFQNPFIASPVTKFTRPSSQEHSTSVLLNSSPVRFLIPDFFSEFPWAQAHSLPHSILPKLLWSPSAHPLADPFTFISWHALKPDFCLVLLKSSHDLSIWSQS